MIATSHLGRVAALSVALAAACIAQAQLVTNGIFTDGVGSLNGWTLVDNSPTRPSPQTGWNGSTDFAEIISGDGINQVFSGYTAAEGDVITFGFMARNGWNTPTVVVTLFTDGNPLQVVATETPALDGGFFGGSWGTYSYTYTAVGADAGKTVGIAFNVLGVEVDDRWVAIDDVTASVSAVPEPSTYAAFLGAGVLGLVLLRRRMA